jgi:hypothetical protein
MRTRRPRPRPESPERATFVRVVSHLRAIVLAAEALHDEAGDHAALRARLAELDAWAIKGRAVLDAVDKGRPPDAA